MRTDGRDHGKARTRGAGEDPQPILWRNLVGTSLGANACLPGAPASLATGGPGRFRIAGPAKEGPIVGNADKKHKDNGH